MSVNLNSNFSRILRAKDIITTSITDGVATLEGGTLSNLYNPVIDNGAATKYYVDNFINTGGVSLPLDSIQINTGTSFIGVNTLKYDTTTGTMLLYNKLDNGTISITDNVITNVSNPILSTDACTYNYFNGTNSNLSLVELSTTVESTSLVASQIINKYINRTIVNSGSIIQDILPTSDAIIEELGRNENIVDTNYSFRFVYYFSGTANSVLLFGNIYPYGNFNELNNAIPVLTIPKGTIVDFSASFDSGNTIGGTSGTVSYFINNYQYLYSEPRINSVGIETANFVSNKISLNDKLNANFIIWPVVSTPIASSTPHTYTYSEIKNKLIVRSGLSGNTIDTFDILSTFTNNSAWSLGSGQIKFTIQNISSYDLQVGPNVAPTGWSYNTTFTRTVPSGKNGFFYINYDGTTLYLYTIGIYDRNG